MTSRIRLGILVLLSLAGCAGWQPSPVPIPDELQVVQTQRIGDVDVSVAILDPQQAKAHFGVDIDEQGIQAIWLRVRNRTDRQFWFLRTVLDMDVYSADEVALMYGSKFSDEVLSELRQHLRDESMRLKIPKKTESQGFVFVPKAYGGRYVDVRLVQDVYEAELARQNSLARGAPVEAPLDLELRFEYTVPLPDGMFDFEGLDAARNYAKTRPTLNSREALREALKALPCCSVNKSGDGAGDPLNLVVVGAGTSIMHSLARAGWSFTHRINFESVTRLIGASLSKQAYPVAPVSDLFLFDRKQDFALQRPRANIAQRNHMRLWLAPFTYREQDVWVGQISRDIGVKLTSKSSSLTTHIIDPDVDLAREYLLQSLLAGGFVDTFGFVAGAPVASRESPVRNLMDDPYFSDGKRLVVILSPDPKPYSEVRSLLWERSGAPIAEEQSGAASENTRPLGSGASE